MHVISCRCFIIRSLNLSDSSSQRVTYTSVSVWKIATPEMFVFVFSICWWNIVWIRSVFWACDMFALVRWCQCVSASALHFMHWASCVQSVIGCEPNWCLERLAQTEYEISMAKLNPYVICCGLPPRQAIDSITLMSKCDFNAPTVITVTYTPMTDKRSIIGVRFFSCTLYVTDVYYVHTPHKKSKLHCTPFSTPAHNTDEKPVQSYIHIIFWPVRYVLLVNLWWELHGNYAQHT